MGEEKTSERIDASEVVVDVAEEARLLHGRGLHEEVHRSQTGNGKEGGCRGSWYAPAMIRRRRRARTEEHDDEEEEDHDRAGVDDELDRREELRVEREEEAGDRE